MQSEWCYFTDVLSANQCADIITYCKTLELKEATMGLHGTRVDSNRKSRITMLHRSAFTAELFDLMWTIANNANKHWLGNINLTKLDELQFAEYNSAYTGEYKPHSDVFWLNSISDYHRKLTIIIQLSNSTDYTGGDFELYDVTYSLPQEQIRQQGTVLVFPSLFKHAVLPVTKGIRYSLTGWIDGPKWR